MIKPEIPTCLIKCHWEDVKMSGLILAEAHVSEVQLVSWLIHWMLFSCFSDLCKAPSEVDGSPLPLTAPLNCHIFYTAVWLFNDIYPLVLPLAQRTNVQ